MKKEEHIEAIFLAAQIAEFHTRNIRSHLERIRKYSFSLAEELNFSENECETISLGCVLHDIGKISIPEEINLKSDKLSPKDWELIKKHTYQGAKLLEKSTSPIIAMGKTIALSHHERWDGSGYPSGLERNAIPLPGRICAVADVFDALTTPRSYKKEISPIDAKTIILNSAGKLFDPAVVDAFEQRFEEISQARFNF